MRAPHAEPDSCRGRRWRCRAASRSPWSARLRGEYATSVSTIRQPAEAARSTISSGYPLRRSRMSSPCSASVRATRIGPMSVTCDAGDRRMRRERNALASRACTGQAERCVGTRRPSTRSAPPSSSADEHAAVRPGRARRRRRTRRRSALGRRDACRDRGTESTSRLGHDGGAGTARDVRRPIGRPVVDDDRPVPRRHPPEHPGQRAHLVQARQHEIDVRHAPTLGSPDSAVGAKVLRNADSSPADL